MPANDPKHFATLSTRLRRLVQRLQELGYVFRDPSQVLPGPSPDVDRHLSVLAAQFGAIPVALATFYRTVGTIDLTGTHSDWRGCAYPDPLVVYPVEAAVDEATEYSELEDPKDYWAGETGRFRVPIAPDPFHKANVSGGMWLGIELPASSEDPLVLEAPIELPSRSTWSMP